MRIRLPKGSLLDPWVINALAELFDALDDECVETLIANEPRPNQLANETSNPLE